VGVVEDDFEIFRFWPIVDAVRFTDHEGPFSEVIIFIEGEFSIAMVTVGEVDIESSILADIG